MYRTALLILCLFFGPVIIQAGCLSNALTSVQSQISDQSSPPNFSNNHRYRLTVAAIFQNEGRFLREWIEYYILMGVEHFYLYNNFSDDNFEEVLAPYITSGLVELIDWSLPVDNVGSYIYAQLSAYSDAISKGESEWMALIDIDEFFVPTHCDTLLELLKQHQENDIGGIIIPWVMFGTSYVPHIPDDKLLIETLLLNDGPNWKGPLHKIWNTALYKSIVRPDVVCRVYSPHIVSYYTGYRHELLSTDEAQTNHYWVRDEDFFYNIKIPRCERWGTPATQVIQKAEGYNHKTDYHLSIQRFVPELRKRLGFQQ